MKSAEAESEMIVQGVFKAMSRLRAQLVTLIAVASLAACVSHDGKYSPACQAFAGDRIELRQGQFVWEKFSDSVVVDSYGTVVNQYPGYPVRGNFHTEGRKVSMESNTGEALAEMYLVRQGGRHYLLTSEQHAAWKETGRLVDCALALGEESGT